MKELLKVLTCGSVDDGKSTLMGRMLYDAKLLFADQVHALELDSQVSGQDGRLDYALLLDGLMAEREQGITIDVAYRYFATRRRSFIVADTPGHEEYTRNMAVGASFAQLAVILVDVTRGILMQTRRHAHICALMGIRYVVFAVNKMDLVQYEEAPFLRLKQALEQLAAELGLSYVKVIPVSALEGDCVTRPSLNMPWYQGKTLLDDLETVEISGETETGFVMPVQRVCRQGFRGFQGQIASGRIALGDVLTVLPSGEQARVLSILHGDKEATEACSGQPVTIRLDREVDVSRGCVLEKDADLEIGNRFAAALLWMDDAELVQGRNFLLKLGTKLLPATVDKIRYQIDVDSGQQLTADRLGKNQLAVCEIALAELVPYDTFTRCSALGRLILIDRVSYMTAACGVIRHPLGRMEHPSNMTRELRSASLGQKPVTLWFTGLSGAGKSTLANEIEKALAAQGRHTMLLDGDNLRMGLNRDLGFGKKDRMENIRRVAETAKLMNDGGLIVLAALISPFQADREQARKIIGSFVEIYVSTPLEVCEARDVKGLYQKARQGTIPEFTGISSPYEPPLCPEITVDTSKCSLEETVNMVLKALECYLS